MRLVGFQSRVSPENLHDINLSFARHSSVAKFVSAVLCVNLELNKYLYFFPVVKTAVACGQEMGALLTPFLPMKLIPSANVIISPTLLFL